MGESGQMVMMSATRGPRPRWVMSDVAAHQSRYRKATDGLCTARNSTFILDRVDVD